MKRLIIGLIVVMLLVPFSCAPPAPAPMPAPAPTKIATILDIGYPLAQNWDADADIDGLELYLTPKDEEGIIVQAPGVVSAKLWLERTFLEGGGKGDLVQEWNDIQVKKDDYYLWLGAKIRLEYKGFRPKQMQFGILEVTFITPDGKSFSARAISVMLGEF